MDKLKQLLTRQATRISVAVLLAGGVVAATLIYATGNAPVAGSFRNNLVLVITDGGLSETLPFNTSPLLTIAGGEARSVRMNVTVRRPDGSEVFYQQRTDEDGRIRGQLYGTVANQIGDYTMTITPEQGGPVATDGFHIEKDVYEPTLRQGAFGARPSSQQSLNGDAYTKINFGTEELDISNWYDPGTSRFTPKVKGLYEITATMYATAYDRPGLFLYKNGTLHRTFGFDNQRNEETVGINGSTIVEANGTTDYFEIYGYSINTTTVLNADLTRFEAQLVAPR